MTEGLKKTRHILALSGGKDSSALAVFMLNKVPDMEYVFCDTEKELDETYEYLLRLETYIGKKIFYLKYSNGYGFDDILQLKNGFLPSPEHRWCTSSLKLKPYEDFIGNDTVVSYVGIRADEQSRKGYISNKSNIKTVFPFIENNIRHEDVLEILKSSGLGLPEYYKWRSRSGCYFCFFQQKIEWVGLFENHHDLFKKAMEYEKKDFTWMQDESLSELSKPERIAQIKEDYIKRQSKINKKFISNQKLKDLWANDNSDYDFEIACNICHL